MTKKNPLARASDPIKALADAIKRLSHRHPTHRVFSDFVELSAIAIHNSVEPRDSERWQRREARYFQIIKTYSKEELSSFTELLALLTDALSAGPADVLGQLFMALELGSHWIGQFFTPIELAKLMARMTLGTPTAEDIEARGGFIALNEPACGSGCMVLAFADAMAESHLNYQQQLHVTAQDLDITAVHMAYVQLSLMHIPAVILHGNSLMVEVRDYWLTPAHILGRWDYRLARRAAAALPPHRSDAVCDSAESDQGEGSPDGEAPVALDGLASVSASIARSRLDRTQLALF